MIGFALYGPQAASHRVRLAQYVLALQQAGIPLRVDALLGDAYVKARYGQGSSLWLGWLLLRAALRRLMLLVRLRLGLRSHPVWLYAELFPLVPAWLELLLLPRPYVLDLDDAFYLKYRTGKLRLLASLLGGKFDRLIESAAAVTAGSSELVRYAAQFNSKVLLLPSVVDTDHYRRAQAAGTDQKRPFTVGWIGSPSTAPYLQMLVGPLAQLAREQPLRLLVIGAAWPAIPGVQVEHHPWDAATEVGWIQQFDVGVMPLPNTPWTRGKCAYKLIQCMACGVPVVASPVGANVEVVTPDTGFLAADAAAWKQTLRNLRDDPALRRQLGRAARQRVQQHYSLQVTAPALVQLINSLA